MAVCCGAFTCLSALTTCRPITQDYNLPGTYRSMLMKPKDLRSRLMYYDDITENLLIGDKERLEGQVPADVTSCFCPYPLVC